LSTVDTATIRPIAIRSDSSEVYLDSNTLVTISIDSSRLAKFIDASGSLVPSPLANVKYGDARGGKIRVLRNIVPDTASLKWATISVTAPQGTGTRTLCFCRLSLRFLHKDPRRIWPYIKPPSARKFRTGYLPTRQDTLELRKPTGRTVSNALVSTSISYSPKTGGHNHTTSADTLMPDSSKGTVFWQYWMGNPLTNMCTNAVGRIIIDSIRSSQFAGLFTVRIMLAADTTVYDTLLLNVQADSLVDLGTGTYWRQTGNISGQGANHSSSHWCMQYFKDSLLAGMADFLRLLSNRFWGIACTYALCKRYVATNRGKV